MLRRIVFTAVFCGMAAAASAQRIDMATLAPADSTWFKVMENMGAEWKKISGGSVNLVIHAGGVLGDEPECVRRLDHRSIQAAGLSGAGLGDIDQGVACLQIPMMFDSYAGAGLRARPHRAQAGTAPLQKGYVVLYWSDVGWVQFFSTTPVQQAGRSAQAAACSPGRATLPKRSCGEPNGFRVVPLPATDIVMQLKMHNLDAVPETALYAETTQLYTLTPYMCDVKWAPLVGATIVSRQVWESHSRAAARPHAGGGAQVGRCAEGRYPRAGRPRRRHHDGRPTRQEGLEAYRHPPGRLPRWPTGASRPKPCIPR